MRRDIELTLEMPTAQPGGLGVWAAIAGHEDFWSALREVSYLHLAHVVQLPPAMRWLFGDLGRTSLTITATVLDAHPEGLTLSSLYRVARRNRICSAGRVIQYYDVGVAKGWFTPGDNSKRKVKRHTAVSEEFRAALGPIFVATVIGLRRMDMCDDDVVVWASQPENFHTICKTVGLAADSLVEPICAPEVPISTMMSLEGGARVLEALLVAHFMGGDAGGGWTGTRQELADTCGISRTQLKRVLDTGSERRLLIVDNGPIRISPLFLEGVKHEYAYLMAVTHAALSLCGWPMRHAGYAELAGVPVAAERVSDLRGPPPAFA